MNIKKIYKPSFEDVAEALSRDINNARYIDNLQDYMIDLIKIDRRYAKLIRWLPIQHFEVVRAACKADFCVLRHVRSRDHLTKLCRMYKICYKNFNKSDPTNLLTNHDHSESDVLRAIERDPFSITLARSETITLKVVEELVRQSPKNFALIRNPTQEMMLKAIITDPQSINSMRWTCTLLEQLVIKVQDEKNRDNVYESMPCLTERTMHPYYIEPDSIFV